jgi:hypothetical protein
MRDAWSGLKVNAEGGSRNTLRTVANGANRWKKARQHGISAANPLRSLSLEILR